MPSTGNIVVVDDNQLSRESICELLGELGCRTRSADRGLRALAMLHDERCDLLVSDVDMPDISGFELLARVRRELMPGPPVLLLSARADEAMSVAARDADALALMAKPVQMGPFTSLIQRLLDH